MWLFWGFLFGSPRLCRLRTEGLVPMSKYWTYRSLASDMSPVSLVAYCRQMFGLSALLQWLLGEKLRWVPRTTQPGWEVESGALFLRSSESVQLCWVSVKDCHVRGPPTENVCRAYVDWRGKRTWRVGQVFPCRVYIDSNRRDSRIWVTACLWLPSSINLQD
jgi:hypothetical protein